MSVQYGGDKITFADGSTVASGWSGFKNRIINGAMMIDQRNAGARVTPIQGQYLVDRWNVVLTQASKFTAQQNSGSVTPPTGFTKYLGAVSSSAYSIVSGDVFGLRQTIEGFNIADLGWGTASAAPVTISFWVRSSLTGTFGGAVQNAAQTQSYPFSYSINVANTWEQKTVTIAGSTTGTWAADNTAGLQLSFGLGVGSTYSATAGTWASGNYWSPPSATSVVGTNGATFYITGVQLEKGSTATSFDYRPYGTELALCQRYYEASSTGRMYVNQGGAATQGCSTFYKVTKRTATPTLTLASGTIDQQTADGFSFYQIVGAGVWVGTTFTSSAEI